MLFQAVIKYLSSSNFFKILSKRLKVHWGVEILVKLTVAPYGYSTIIVLTNRIPERQANNGKRATARLRVLSLCI